MWSSTRFNVMYSLALLIAFSILEISKTFRQPSYKMSRDVAVSK